MVAAIHGHCSIVASCVSCSRLVGQPHSRLVTPPPHHSRLVTPPCHHLCHRNIRLLTSITRHRRLAPMARHRVLAPMTLRRPLAPMARQRLLAPPFLPQHRPTLMQARTTKPPPRVGAVSPLPGEEAATPMQRRTKNPPPQGEAAFPTWHLRPPPAGTLAALAQPQLRLPVFPPTPTSTFRWPHPPPTPNLDCQ